MPSIGDSRKGTDEAPGYTNADQEWFEETTSFGSWQASLDDVLKREKFIDINRPKKGRYFIYKIFLGKNLNTGITSDHYKEERGGLLSLDLNI